MSIGPAELLYVRVRTFLPEAIFLYTALSASGVRILPALLNRTNFPLRVLPTATPNLKPRRATSLSLPLRTCQPLLAAALTFPTADFKSNSSTRSSTISLAILSKKALSLGFFCRTSFSSNSSFIASNKFFQLILNAPIFNVQFIFS